MRSMSVAADVLLHLSEKAIPTAENRRSTAAELAGQPRYCRATSIIILGAAYTVTCPDPGRTPKLRVVMDPLTLP